MFQPYISNGQFYGLLGLGSFYWAAAAVAIRYAGHVLFRSRESELTFFASLAPISYGVMSFSESVIGLDTRHRLVSASIMSSMALLLDGTAFMFFPEVYENPEMSKTDRQKAVYHSRKGAASILWGVGVILGIALYTTTY